MITIVKCWSYFSFYFWRWNVKEAKSFEVEMPWRWKGMGNGSVIGMWLLAPLYRNKMKWNLETNIQRRKQIKVNIKDWNLDKAKCEISFQV